MREFVFSGHALDMMMERGIDEAWVWRTLETFTRKRRGKDGNMHYTKPIRERGGRVLHVVVTDHKQPNQIITIFFDRRLKR